VAAGALVAPEFHPPTPEERAQARAAFGLPAGRLALIAAGAWGIGRVGATAADVAASKVATPVVVCGNNHGLRESLRRAGVPALGWVDSMPLLMRAVDVLVENGGGLTALEGMSSGLPVATYRPIAGHGHLSAAAMAKAGVSTWVRRRSALGPTLTRLMDGDLGEVQRAAAAPMLRADPAELVARLASSTPPHRSRDLRGAGPHEPARRPRADRREWTSLDTQDSRSATEVERARGEQAR
jgi:processive 1,2-diacylglycerol beta-glucosyltransferase